MQDSIKAILDIEYLSGGYINIINNLFYNCSSTDEDLIILHVKHDLNMINNAIDRCSSQGMHLISTDIAEHVIINGLTISNTVHDPTSTK
jgi:hypothetical protein